MKTIGRYIVRGLLGRGAMGRIYKVELPVVGRISALKLLDPDPLLLKILGKDQLHERFIDEALTMAGLDHPNIVTIHDFDAHDGRPFYTMDFFANNLGVVIGESYRVERPSRCVNIGNALNYIGQTLEGLACLHAVGIVHRDIKPYNLLLTHGDVIRICDFGLSRQRGERFGGPSNLNVGTPFYAAPEQERNPDSADHTADLYSVGVMMYRMVTGRLPERSVSAPDGIPSIQLHPELNPGWDEFLSRALAIDPGKRFADAHAMLAALKQLHEHWLHHRVQTCALPVSRAPEEKAADTETRSLRHTPVKIPVREARSRFHLDKLWRPRAYRSSLFVSENAILRDPITGLVWQQAGSPFPASWAKARDFIADLNRNAHAGITTWRLPTIEELITILRPPSQGVELCLPSQFDPAQRWLWSADRKSFTAAYYIDTALGFIGWQDLDAPYYVRAVSHFPN